MFTTRTLIAVLLAGIVGTIVNSLAAAAVVGAPLAALLTRWGGYVVAILVAALLPVIYARMAGAAAHAVAVAALTIIPSLLAKFVFGIGAPWGIVLILNAVYAVAAILTYLAFLRSGARV